MQEKDSKNNLKIVENDKSVRTSNDMSVKSGEDATVKSGKTKK